MFEMSNLLLWYEIVWLKKKKKKKKEEFFSIHVKTTSAGIEPCPFGFEGHALLHVREQ